MAICLQVDLQNLASLRVKLQPSEFLSLGEREKDQPHQTEFLWIPEVCQACRHVVMSALRLVLVCMEQAIPPGDVEAEIAVVFADVMEI